MVDVRGVGWASPASRKLDLDDGRSLIIQFEPHCVGWVAVCSAGTVFGATPLEAMANAVGLDMAHAPSWMTSLSSDLQQERAGVEAGPRYACECCGFKSLLSEGHYEICPVCRWEDDRADRRPEGIDTHSGPNHLTLRQAQANFKVFGACDERRRLHARRPQASEQP